MIHHPFVSFTHILGWQRHDIPLLMTLLVERSHEAAQAWPARSARIVGRRYTSSVLGDNSVHPDSHSKGCLERTAALRPIVHSHRVGARWCSASGPEDILDGRGARF